MASNSKLLLSAFICFCFALLAFPQPSQASEVLTCSYFVKARTSDATGAGSHGGAYATVSNGDGAWAELYLRRTYNTSVYNFVAGDAAFFATVGPCVEDITTVTLEMDGSHSWYPVYVVVDNVSKPSSTVTCTVGSWITQVPTVIDNCSTTTTKSLHHRPSRN